MALELVKQLVDFSRLGHVNCIRIAVNGSPVASRELARVFRSITTSPETSHSFHHTRNGLPAIFFLFAARFSNSVLVAFFLLSFFRSIPLLICYFSILRQRDVAS